MSASICTSSPATTEPDLEVSERTLSLIDVALNAAHASYKDQLQHCEAELRSKDEEIARLQRALLEAMSQPPALEPVGSAPDDAELGRFTRELFINPDTEHIKAALLDTRSCVLKVALLLRKHFDVMNEVGQAQEKTLRMLRSGINLSGRNAHRLAHTCGVLDKSLRAMYTMSVEQKEMVEALHGRPTKKRALEPAAAPAAATSSSGKPPLHKRRRA